MEFYSAWLSLSRDLCIFLASTKYKLGVTLNILGKILFYSCITELLRTHYHLLLANNVVNPRINLL